MNIIYKFLPPQKYAFAFFDNGKLRISQLSALNDPFECLSFYVGADSNRIAERMVKEGKHSEKWLNLVAQNCDQTNQILPWVAMDEASNLLNTSIGILCFCEIWHSSKMWGYYADKHAGFCIGFDADHPFWGGISNSIEYGHLCKVTYDEKRNRCDLTNGENPEIKQFFTKSTDWEHEKEVRAIYRLEEKDATGYDDMAERVYCKTIPRDAITEIIIGFNANAGIMRACLQFGQKHAIPIYRCLPQLKNETFEMTRYSFKEMPPWAAKI